jgi:hypothetical protein
MNASCRYDIDLREVFRSWHVAQAKCALSPSIDVPSL